jgi:hypothetical protein
MIDGASNNRVNMLAADNGFGSEYQAATGNLKMNFWYSVGWLG